MLILLPIEIVYNFILLLSGDYYCGDYYYKDYYYEEGYFSNLLD